jgi:1,4-dihydroxy-2-naphthoate octaprenyltransferase
MPTWRGGRPTSRASCAGPETRHDLRRFLLGARPRTLPAAVVPVAVGGAIAWWRSTPRETDHGVSLERLLLALLVSVAIQVGTNYANDFSDGVRGTDDVREGPVRLVASGAVSARSVLVAALCSFGVAGVAGLVIASETSWWLVLLGAACIGAGWLYTGGPRPYGYAGLGEAFVFLFFGLVATMGTAYVASIASGDGVADRAALAGGMGELLALGALAALPVGMLAVALLLANNIRDIEGDRRAGKRTLAVRIGRAASGRLFVACLLVALLGVVLLSILRPLAALALLALPLGIGPSRRALSTDGGSSLLPMLAETGRLQLVVGLLLAVGVLL